MRLLVQVIRFLYPRFLSPPKQVLIRVSVTIPPPNRAWRWHDGAHLWWINEWSMAHFVGEIRDVSLNHVNVSENYGTPKSSIWIGFSIINHPFWGTPNFWKHPCSFDMIPKKKNTSKNTTPKKEKNGVMTSHPFFFRASKNLKSQFLSLL